MKEFLDILTFAAVLGSGLVAGIFFAFSTFVMRALGQLPENQGIAAMKSINVTVLNPWFFLAFFGTGAVCLPVAFLALGSAAGAHRAYLLAACALYLLGCLLVTVAFNVPLNNRLASAEPDSSAQRRCGPTTSHVGLSGITSGPPRHWPRRVSSPWPCVVDSSAADSGRESPSFRPTALEFCIQT